MIFFYTVFVSLIIQRLVELWIARRNQQWMLAHGGIEIGAEHYPLLVLMHISFFAGLWTEVVLRGYAISFAWPILLAALIIVQGIRYWAITSLGRFWNTRIIIIPGADVVRRGPYQFLRHPNYTVVILELALIPLLFNAYITCVAFSILNALVLSYRIRVEEEGLASYTAYTSVMQNRLRFLPKKPE